VAHVSFIFCRRWRSHHVRWAAAYLRLVT
jgi:hypothetical protein